MQRFKRTLVIGLGGIGQIVLADVKKRLQEEFGDGIPGIRLLSIDVDELQDSAAKYLGGDEFLQCSLPDIRDLLALNPELGAWFESDLVELPAGALQHGSWQKRQIGRLALFHNFDMVMRVVCLSMDAIQSREVMSDPKWQVSEERPEVIFVGSLAGGAGGGMLLDLASAMREQSPETPHNGLLMMPGVLKGFPHCEFADENAYAFLKELDFFMASDAAIRRGDFGDVFTVSSRNIPAYRLAFPFDDIELFDENGMDGLVGAGGPAALAGVIGGTIHAMICGPIGDAIASVERKPSSLLGLAWLGDKQCWYGTAGMAEVHYPVEQVAALAESLFISLLLDRMRRGDQTEGGQVPPAPSELAMDFIELHRLAGLGEAQNRSIDAILPPTAYQPSLPRQVTRELGPDLIWARNRDELEARLVQRAAIAASNREALIERVSYAIEGELDRLVRAGSGEAVVEDFLVVMRRHLEQVGSNMKAANAAAAEQVQQARRSEEELKAVCASASKKLFGGKEAVARVLGLYGATLQSADRAQDDEIRTRETMVFCSSMEAIFDDAANWDSEWLAILLKTTEDSTEASREALSQKGAFEIRVYPDLASIETRLPVPSIVDFYAWFTGEKGNASSLDFWRLTASAALTCLHDYAQRGPGVARALRDQSLADVIRALSDHERGMLLKEVVRLSNPLPSIRSSHETQYFDAPEGRMLVGGPLGFPESFNEPNSDECVRSLRTALEHLLPGTKVMELETCSRTRAVFVHRCGPFPAYALGAFEQMRSEYAELAAMDVRRAPHLDKRWAELLPDLEPESPTR